MVHNPPVDYHITSDINNQISIMNDSRKIYLDPKHILDENYIFISHAHTDHLLNKNSFKKFNLKDRIICSQETIAIANLRGYCMAEFSSMHEDCKLVDTGHILGSKGLLVNDRIFYTGDLSTRNRAFLKIPEIPRAEVLIIESTFGKPEYIFPSIEKIVHSVNSLISEMYNRGIPVILMGYSLGKAQVLTSLFGAWKPLIVHDEISKFNQMYQNFGISLQDSTTLSVARETGLLEKKPWTLIHPLMNCKNPMVSYLKAKYDAVTIGFSGWAINSNYRNMMNLDYVIPFSDHCDFNELVEVVKKCRPEKIYTFHGFQSEFANYLVKLGYKAESVTKEKKILKKKLRQVPKLNKLDIYF